VQELVRVPVAEIEDDRFGREPPVYLPPCCMARAIHGEHPATGNQQLDVRKAERAHRSTRALRLCVATSACSCLSNQASCRGSARSRASNGSSSSFCCWPSAWERFSLSRCCSSCSLFSLPYPRFASRRSLDARSPLRTALRGGRLRFVRRTRFDLIQARIVLTNPILDFIQLSGIDRAGPR